MNGCDDVSCFFCADRRRTAKMAVKPGEGDRRDRKQPQRVQPGRKRMPSDRRTLDLFEDDALPHGFKYQSDFLSREEEHSLLHDVKKLPFREFEFHGFTGKRRIVSFGWRYDFNGGGLTKTEDMPEFLLKIRDKAAHFANIQ